MITQSTSLFIKEKRRANYFFFRVSFKILDWKLCIAWLITVDFSNSVVTEDHISIEGLRCVAPQQVIKRCSNNCPAGFPFFRSFIDNIKAYIASRKK